MNDDHLRVVLGVLADLAGPSLALLQAGRVRLGGRAGGRVVDALGAL